MMRGQCLCSTREEERDLLRLGYTSKNFVKTDDPEAHILCGGQEKFFESEKMKRVRMGLSVESCDDVGVLNRLCAEGNGAQAIVQEKG